MQIPDDIYREAERIARERQVSLTEVVRRGLELIVRANPPGRPKWTPPQPRWLGSFQALVENWRILGNEPDAPL